MALNHLSMCGKQEVCGFDVDFRYSFIIIRGLLEKYPTVFFLCEHLMDYNLARLHEPTLNLSAHA